MILEAHQMLWSLHTSRAVAEKSDNFECLLVLVEKYLQGFRMGARPHTDSHGPRRANRTNNYREGRRMENVLLNEGIITISQDKLPPEFVEFFHTMQETAHEKLQRADRTLRKIHGLFKAMQTAGQLAYDHQQLGKVEFEATTEWLLENSSRTTAFIVTYGRLFTESKGTYKIERRKVPDELGDIHDEVMRMRNQLYAHNGDHESINTYPEMGFEGQWNENVR
ncbi:hypothetical protein [Klebsiella sp. BIGb0407]|uniref:hypothetical protein n=1 Tax=Klebsiella sp. BIGb0407 TaxID=2940603 RepID=UPI0021689F67|nr:hypothetical protein [Klebsiella sp. BIGb0407]MCS3434265.1 hypothetical protein [Klebsiella sp. BIGb0407]